jgi:hypothetical protein
MPLLAYADEVTDETADAVAEETDAGEAEFEYSEGLPEDAFDGLDISSEDELLEGYMMKEARGNEARSLEKSSRAWNLSGKDLTYYNKVKGLAQKVASGAQSETYLQFSGSQVLSKTKYTASELGLSKVAYKSGGKLVLTAAAEKKINQMLAPNDWSGVMTAALLDMPYELYWYNRVHNSQCVWNVNWYATYTTTSVTISTDPSKTYCVIMLPLISDYAVALGGGDYYIYKADTAKTKSVEAAINNAKAIVANHAGESDYNKLKSYLDEVCELTDYNEDAYEKSIDPNYETYQVYNSPWQMIDVFDGNPDTKVICAGYGKAYKFLCDISDFRSNWIECQTIYGTVGTVYSGKVVDPGAHLWCTVRMNDGKNYIVDPTWYDSGYNVFLQGGASGNGYGYCDVYTNGIYSLNNYTIRYEINDLMKKMFSAEELTIAADDYSDAQDSPESDALIDISGARITGHNLTYTGSALTDEHPVVKVDGRTLTEGSDYIVTGFSKNKNVGKASFTVVGIGQYSGSKTGTFGINPKNTTGFSLYKGSKSFKIKWKKQSAKMSTTRITGYQIQYSTSSTFKSGNKSVKVKGYKSVSKTIKSLKAKKKYYVRIRTYKTINGKTYYSPWSSVKYVKTR